MSVLSNYNYHLLAILVAGVWGATFVSTKVLIGHGLSPIEIMVCRFLIAYICIWAVCPRKLFARNIKDELLCVGTGLTGGSLYFLFENTALGITLASNVSLIICTSPIFTAFVLRLIYRKEKIKNHLIVGSLIALVGVSCVVFNGSFVLKINPLGDILTLLAALSWAFYGSILKELNKRYSTLFVTRKTFIYGILTILPFSFFGNNTFNPHLLTSPVVVLNLLFLGVVASLLCYIAWNNAIKVLGVVQTSNYIYLIPLVTLIASALVIHERITCIALIGSVCIILGVYIAEKGYGKNRRTRTPLQPS